jgi:hypothetical protein
MANEPHMRLAFQKVDHARAVVQKRVDLGGVEVLTALDLKIPLGAGAVVGLARLRFDGFGVVRAGHPQPAARRGGGAAEHRGLLGHDDRKPPVAGGKRGGEGRAAGADDEDVAGAGGVGHSAASTLASGAIPGRVLPALSAM